MEVRVGWRQWRRFRTGTGGQVLGASASCGIYLDQYIHPVRKYLNDPTEVRSFRRFLNMNLGINLPVSGNYGSTIAAVDQFQVKYHIEVLQPWLNYGCRRNIHRRTTCTRRPSAGST
jgi:hypothetical protein